MVHQDADTGSQQSHYPSLQPIASRNSPTYSLTQPMSSHADFALSQHGARKESFTELMGLQPCYSCAKQIRSQVEISIACCTLVSVIPHFIVFILHFQCFSFLCFTDPPHWQECFICYVPKLFVLN